MLSIDHAVEVLTALLVALLHVSEQCCEGHMKTEVTPTNCLNTPFQPTGKL